MKPFLPIVKQPVLLHSSRDPGPCKLTPAQCAFKSRYWLFWYRADLVYGLPVVYFVVAAIALFALGRLAADAGAGRLSRAPAWRRAVAGVRFLAYRSWRVAGRNTQPLGFVVAAAAAAAFFAGLTLGPRPYYWPTDAHYGGSPPLATRSGWLALACLPFVLALGAKANLVSALTRVPPEKLNIWHNWLSRAMFALAIVHMCPYIVFHDFKGDTAKAFRKHGVWLTGVVAMLSLGWLSIMSVSWIRNRCYEFFKATHLFFAATFFVFLFLHVDFRLSSWDYLIAAASVYLASLLYAWGKTYLGHGVGHKAHLSLETPDSLRIAIRTTSSWAPGQHMYLRFLACGAHALTSHPLTVCSLPDADAGGGELLFYVQPRRGLTARLARLAEKQHAAGVKVLLEGPYGGLPARWRRGFDRTLLVAGGSGCGFTLALISDWLRRRTPLSSSELIVVLASRDPGMRVWYLRELQQLAERRRETDVAETPGLSISLYETDSAKSVPADKAPGASSSDDDEKGQPKPKVSDDATVASRCGIRFFRGRPDTRAALRNLSLREPHGSVGVAVCGPSSMVHDVGAEAAAQQQRILSGQAGAPEVWFHREAFSY